MEEENRVVEFFAEDGAKLDGYIHKCGLPTNKILIEIHGMTSNCFKKREKVIANKVQNINIDSLCFNTRGSEIVKYIKYKDGNKKLAGTAYEDIEESYFDILGVIKYVIGLGYTSIYLQGHSLGATKVVYAYDRIKKENNKYLQFIKGILLLSLVDIPDMIKTYSNNKTIQYANEKNEKGEVLDLMHVENFIHLISVKTFLKYINCPSINFAKYSNEDDQFEVLNSINVPIFMRWGSINEFIKKSAEEQVKFMNQKITNSQKDINFIKDANHSYNGKEEILANEISNFLSKIKE